MPRQARFAGNFPPAASVGSRQRAFTGLSQKIKRLLILSTFFYPARWWHRPQFISGAGTGTFTRLMRFQVNFVGSLRPAMSSILRRLMRMAPYFLAAGTVIFTRLMRGPAKKSGGF